MERKAIGTDGAPKAIGPYEQAIRVDGLVFTAGQIPRIPLNVPLLKGCSIVGVAWDTYSRRNPAGGKINVDEMIAWITAGKLKPVVTAEYTLDNAARALEDVMQRRVQGKVVIVP